MPNDQPQTQILSPSLRELDEVPGISDLIESIVQFIRPSTSKNRPENVALIYLAFCQSLQSQEIASIDTMPPFKICFRGQKLLVTPTERSADTSDVTMKTGSSEKGRNSKDGQKMTKHTKDRLSLLKDILKRRVQRAAESHVLQGDRVPHGENEDRLSLEVIDSPASNTLTEENVLNMLRQVMKIVSRSEEAANQVALAYYNLGKSYVDYAKAKEISLPPVHKQSFHRVALQHLVAITKALNKSELTSAALLKRLERARKVWLLANTFGTGILKSRTVANLTFLDKIPFPVFGDLASSSAEVTFVNEIKRILA